MSMFNDTELERKDNEDSCALTSSKIKECASTFNDGHLAFLGPGSKWYQGNAAEYGGKWDLRASQMVGNFENSGHPVFQGVSPLGRGILKKRNDRETIHFNGEYGKSNFLYRIVHAANQLCFYGRQAKADPKAFATCPRNSIKTGRSQVTSGYSKTTACIGKPNAPEFEGFQLDAIYEQN